MKNELFLCVQEMQRKRTESRMCRGKHSVQLDMHCPCVFSRPTINEVDLER